MNAKIIKFIFSTGVRKDYYKILNVSNKASSDEIKNQFYQLAKTHHPDKNGNTETFKAINEAYQVLGDVESRKKYDFEQKFGKSEQEKYRPK